MSLTRVLRPFSSIFPHNRRVLSWPFAVGALLLPLGGAVQAAPTANDPPTDVQFNRDVRPVLSDKCFACHGFDAKKRKAKLRLDVAEGDLGAFADRENGPAITPGSLDKSQLWARINSKDPDEVMPPGESHKTLSEKEKQTLRRWIEQGAKYQQHWSFEPLRRPDVPKSAKGEARNPIDRSWRRPWRRKA